MTTHSDLRDVVINWNETGLPLDPPTKQERRIMFLLISGVTTNAEIADWLCIEPSTASNHIDNLRSKFGARSRAQLVALIFQTLLSNLLTEVPDTVHQGA
jgi:DNA-binding CsgD family transcriptional regulator